MLPSKHSTLEIRPAVADLPIILYGQYHAAFSSQRISIPHNKVASIAHRFLPQILHLLLLINLQTENLVKVRRHQLDRLLLRQSCELGRPLRLLGKAMDLGVPTNGKGDENTGVDEHLRGAR